MQTLVMSDATTPDQQETADQRKKRLKREACARYRTLHPETPDAVKARYHRNKGDIAAYAGKNKERIRNKSKAWYQRQSATTAGRMRYYTKSAAKRSIEWRLNDAEVASLFKSNCRYCDEPPSPLNGIDRYDNEIGYLASNCVPCCTRCNYMKRCMSVEEFSLQCRKIVDRLNNI